MSSTYVTNRVKVVLGESFTDPLNSVRVNGVPIRGVTGIEAKLVDHNKLTELILHLEPSLVETEVDLMTVRLKIGEKKYRFVAVEE